MYCSTCGYQLSEGFRFCPQCAAPAVSTDSGAARSWTTARLSRPFDQKKIAGVCAGISRYLNIDVTLVRILTVLLALYPPGMGLLFYIVCWIVMPRDPEYSVGTLGPTDVVRTVNP